MATEKTPYLEKILSALMLLGLRTLTQRERIDVLDQAGFGQNDIASLVSSTPKAVSVRLAEIRKARRQRSKKR